MKQRFFRCNRCGQIMTVVNDTNLPVMCCMADMEELIPNTTEAAEEKHIPCVKVEGNKVTVQVGSDKHPMTDVHRITWIAISTCCGMQRKELKEGEEPCAIFMLAPDEKLEGVYAYCNQHGLWMKECQGECQKKC